MRGRIVPTSWLFPRRIPLITLGAAPKALPENNREAHILETKRYLSIDKTNQENTETLDYVMGVLSM